MTARWLGVHRFDLDACGSTNDEAARLARAGAAHGTLVIARAQTAGRGREGRAWVSPDGGLYLSAVVRPPLPLGDVPPMTLAIGVAVCDAVRAYAPAAALKWPNDVLVGTRKLAGVLVESQSRGHRLDAVIVGIGINLADRLPPELGAIALAEAGSFTLADRERLVDLLCGQLERWIDRYVAAGLAPVATAWHERMAQGLTARATLDGAPLTGAVAGLDADGALVLVDDAGRRHRIRSGDVEVIRGTRAGLDLVPPPVATAGVLRPGE